MTALGDAQRVRVVARALKLGLKDRVDVAAFVSGVADGLLAPELVQPAPWAATLRARTVCLIASLGACVMARTFSVPSRQDCYV